VRERLAVDDQPALPMKSSSSFSGGLAKEAGRDVHDHAGGTGAGALHAHRGGGADEGNVVEGSKTTAMCGVGSGTGRRRNDAQVDVDAELRVAVLGGGHHDGAPSAAEAGPGSPRRR
jgi:hypothetical protein